MAEGQRRPGIPGAGGHIPGRGMPIGVPHPGEIPLGDPWEVSDEEVHPLHLEGVSLGPLVGEDPHGQVGTG